MNVQDKAAQELVENMLFSKVLSDENTIIYASELNASEFTFRLYQYDMSRKQNKLIDENVLYKSDRNSYTANGLSWSNDDSKVAITYYENNGVSNSPGQICVLTLKKE